ncbi:hypothetical protein [Caldivirga maquilingensis]|uniref:Uncharacterized protein n=1 Tax=Caldivirga maquilingensis (strain ATCC 700844 / DSM 13496 / JCM 10307 / IC-167) TaxID=397948 RepID=A8MDN8_CALMQ|nr:hypothetical protein [Caldivirga maquilingensis]ABW01894.1 hypothetical protein Cmaq_1065 [Caldivirga maquilingensis IC-167]
MDSEIKDILLIIVGVAIIAIVLIASYKLANLVEVSITWFSNITGINIPANVNFLNPAISTFTLAGEVFIVVGSIIVGSGIIRIYSS